MSHHGQNVLKLANSPKVAQNQINKGIMRINPFDCLILGKKLTCVKFSGAFDGIVEKN